MSIGGGQSSGAQSSTTSLDPQVKNAWLDLENLAKTTAGGGVVPQHGVAGRNGVQAQGDAMTMAAAGAGAPAIQKGVDTAAQLTQLNAQPQVHALNINGVTNQSAPTYGSVRNVTPQAVSGAINPSVPGFGAVRDVTAGQLGNTDLSHYENPYTNDVVNQSLQDIELQRQTAINGNSSDFTSSGGEGAWGGSRAGVADSLTNAAALKQTGDTSAQLRQANFGQAQAAAGQDIANRQAADTTNANMDYGQAGQVFQGTLQDNQHNKDAYNQIQEFNSGQGFQAQQLGQAADLNRADTSYQGQLQQGLANQTAANTIAGQNVANDLTSQQDTAGYKDAGLNRELSAAGLLGQLGGQQQSTALSGAGAVTGVGNAQQAQSQQQLDTAYANSQSQYQQPLQTWESAFGILPTTASGGTTTAHSSGKSGTAGI